jgi:hypothetical protein
MKPRRRITSAEIERALRAADGIVNVAARKLRVEPSTIRRRLKAEPKLREVRDELVESFVDLAETKLRQLVRKGNLGAVIFVCKTLGRSRGYVERQEVDMANVEPIRFYLPKKVPIPDDEVLATYKATPTCDDAGTPTGTMGEIEGKSDPDAPPDGNVH